MMSDKIKEQATKALAKEIKNGAKEYQPRERKFPLDEAVRYILTEEEQKRFDEQHALDYFDTIATESN